MRKAITLIGFGIISQLFILVLFRLVQYSNMDPFSVDWQRETQISADEICQSWWFARDQLEIQSLIVLNATSKSPCIPAYDASHVISGTLVLVRNNTAALQRLGKRVGVCVLQKPSVYC